MPFGGKCNTLLTFSWAGKDLHKLALPTHVSEPLTDTQRRIEAFESSELLDQASLKPLQQTLSLAACDADIKYMRFECWVLK